MPGAPQFDPSIGQRHIIERPRLLKLLDETEAKIILLVAPAGYGKTTLARQWAANKRCAWYRTTAASRDPAVLALALVEATRTTGGSGTGRLATRLGASGAPPPSPGVLAQLLLADVEPVGINWLILDDLHALDGADAAEEFVGEVVERLSARLLVTTRSRPAWATSRKVIYGEILEVQASALAMSESEVVEVLGAKHATGTFISRAAGWPAVVGLASTSDVNDLPDTEVPQVLYEFLAQELRAAASSELRATLATLAIVQRVPTRGSVELAVSRDLVREALRLGILMPASRNLCEMHPLMREFILARAPRDRDSLRASSAHVFAVALAAGDWETAAECVRLSRNPELLADLLAREMDRMIAAGRMETLREWERLAREIDCESAVVSLLRAELAFHDGRYAESALEARVAAEIAPNAPRRAQALSKSARAEYFADNNASAITAYALALEEADSTRARAEALRGLVLASVALDERELDQYWERYLRLPPADAADALRRATTELHVAYFRGRLPEALDAAGRAKDLLRDVSDPMIRSGFRNTFAHTLMLAGRYREGEQEARACLAELREYGLEFGLIHVNLDLARAAIGLKRYADAAALLHETRDAHGSTPFTRQSCDAQLTRIAVIRGGDVRALPASLPRADVNSYAEVLVTRALYDAVRGDPSGVSRTCRRADDLSRSAEVRVLSSWARALACIALGDQSATTHARSALRRSLRSGIFDSLVIAYRAAPQLLDVIRASVSDEECQSLIAVMSRADDEVLSEARGLSHAVAESPLTPRELEVLQLVAAGLSNRDIASKLYISLATAKVHVQHIMEKLDARSRTEAAMKGLALAGQGRPQTAKDTAGGAEGSPTARPSR